MHRNTRFRSLRGKAGYKNLKEQLESGQVIAVAQSPSDKEYDNANFKTSGKI